VLYMRDDGRGLSTKGQNKWFAPASPTSTRGEGCGNRPTRGPSGKGSMAPRRFEAPVRPSSGAKMEIIGCADGRSFNDKLVL